MTVTYGHLPGTVFVSDDKVNFEHFAISGAANDHIVADETDVVTASPGMVALIKGRQWPDCNGVVHRSPFIPKGPAQVLLGVRVWSFIL